MRNRISKVNELIKSELNQVLLQELSLKSGVLVTIAKVDTAPDLRTTRVLVSVFPEEERNYALKALERSMYHLQGELNRRLHLAPLPRIVFLLDTTEIKADEVEHLLRTIRMEEEGSELI